MLSDDGAASFFVLGRVFLDRHEIHKDFIVESWICNCNHV